MLKVGIEHEFVFVDHHGQYLDADVSEYALFEAIVNEFPAFEHDDKFLLCKSLEHYPKRCYVEGFERHDPAGKTVETIPKGGGWVDIFDGGESVQDGGVPVYAWRCGQSIRHHESRREDALHRVLIAV